MSAIAKLWINKIKNLISSGVNKDEVINSVPERWREEVRLAIDNE